MSKTRPVRLISVGKYALPTDRSRPYYAGLDLKGDGVAVMQPMDATSFFLLLNSLLQPVEHSCGQNHVPTVGIPE
jgi:hypothetical protein